MSHRILVTGASGFVGKALTARLISLGEHEVFAMTRSQPLDRLPGARYVVMGDLRLWSHWAEDLVGVDCVVHTAARVHVLSNQSKQSLAEFERVNVTATLNLARQAARVGVRRFVFISSIGVNGDMTHSNAAFTEDDVPQPHNAYANSKLKAELGLRQIAGETGLEVVIIRPPLVYGPGVRANFAALMRAVQRGWPLPLGAVQNLRSMVGIDNLVDFIITCVHHPLAANQTFLVSDGHDVSSAELVRGLARAAGSPPRLLPVPVWLLRAGAKLLGREDVIQRLCGSLRVDIDKAHRVLNWAPGISFDEGLRRTVVAARGE